LVQFVLLKLDTPSVIDALLIAWRDAGIGSLPIELAGLLNTAVWRVSRGCRATSCAFDDDVLCCTGQISQRCTLGVLIAAQADSASQQVLLLHVYAGQQLATTPAALLGHSQAVASAVGGQLSTWR
jgi:hypothetical protein